MPSIAGASTSGRISLLTPPASRGFGMNATPTKINVAFWMPSTVTDGITLFTTHVRRATPDTLDPKLNAHSKLNDITACIQAYTAGADEALMLDPHGFVATCNSTNFFVVAGPEDAPEALTSDGRSASP